MVDGFDQEPLPGIKLDRSGNDGRIPANVVGCRQRTDSDELEPVANHARTSVCDWAGRGGKLTFHG
jgi:hypothetical protein